MVVTLEEMKGYLRVDFDEDDALIESMIRAAEKTCTVSYTHLTLPTIRLV